MFPVIDKAVNNYIGALNLFASIGIDNKSTTAYYAKEVCESIIEYQMDQSYGHERLNYVAIAVKETLRTAKAYGNIYEYTFESLVDTPDRFTAVITLNTVKQSDFELHCTKKNWPIAMWQHYLESLHKKYNQPLRPTEGFAEYMRDR